MFVMLLHTNDGGMQGQSKGLYGFHDPFPHPKTASGGGYVKGLVRLSELQFRLLSIASL